MSTELTKHERPSGHRRSRGFTLIEMILAIVVISVAFPPMLWAIQGAQATRVAPVLFSRARWLASEKLEDVIADRHAATRGYSYVLTGNYPAEAPVSGFTGFTRSVAVVETGPKFVVGGTGYKTVTVTVGWTDGRGTPQTLALSTVLTNYTP